ncbi:MAG: hypothetical protein CDV28_10560 [Candidatus Electronema aureum]|uniref:Uncharacterized protein n=1 Tax=Candidatus Electronema aureum TaxID=2005002 RepID=A0A521G3Q3_9BACT|nr:MAG: hypothetical protein CDV28_10560 [Candidatus Electronema aureum]
MNLLKFVSAGILLTGMLAGCGQTSVETMMVPNGEYPNAQGKGMTAVVLPFADYSSGDRIASAFRRNLMITESLTDTLRRNGFAAPVQEDVFQHLVEQKIINLASYNENQSGSVSLVGELEDPDWSDVMKDKIRDYMKMQQQQESGGRNPAVDSPGAHGLSDQEVVKVGRRFGADYIIRGRILEFRTRQEHTWDPRKRGLLPFVIGSTNRMAFGFADSEQYDNLGNAVSGSAWGAAIGNNAGWPWDPDDSKGFFGVSGGQGANTIVWSMLGGAAGSMANHGGRVDQAVVRLRIWVQNAYDAQVVWTNQVEVRVAPESVLADSQYDDLFDQAIKKATSSLMTDFVQTGLKQ